jgi:hypothetical protein
MGMYVILCGVHQVMLFRGDSLDNIVIQYREYTTWRERDTQYR